jgi:hypothetical protein
MDDDGSTYMSNRDEPIPVLRVPSRDDDSLSPSDSDMKEKKRDKFKSHASRIMDKVEGYSTPDVRQSLQDRMFASIISQIVGEEYVEGDGGDTPPRGGKKDRRSRSYVDRPQFGPRLMANNFRRFNSRIGIAFVLQNRLIRLFTWKTPTATLSFLAIYSLLCLKPHLLPLVPLFGTIFSIMIPSFLARHATPSDDPRIQPSLHGPPTAPASRVKPAPDLSTDFWRNMRDLQNCMEDFSRVHDAANEYITPYTNFSDEAFSSSLYLSLLALSCVAFLGSHIVPWRFVALIGGWLLASLGHPRAQEVLLTSRNLGQLRQQVDGLQMAFRHWVDTDVVLDEPAELRQVEIFELQKYHDNTDTWESWLFSPSPHDPLSPARISEDRPKGTQFFEDVQPPAGWRWKEKKWALDLFSREWVEQRMITGVEIETEGERWVYDIPPEEAEELMDLAMMRTRKTNIKRVRSVPKSGWEEGTGLEPRGEWRRRRWTRLVERKFDNSTDGPTDKRTG